MSRDGDEMLTIMERGAEWKLRREKEDGSSGAGVADRGQSCGEMRVIRAKKPGTL